MAGGDVKRPRAEIGAGEWAGESGGRGLFGKGETPCSGGADPAAAGSGGRKICPVAPLSRCRIVAARIGPCNQALG